STAPTSTAPTSTAPTSTAPTSTAPTSTAPTSTAPTDAAPAAPASTDPDPAAVGGAPAAGAGVQKLLADVAAELGGPLRELSRHDKQRAVLLLEARGAFEYRKSAEIVAEALGVTRFTVYNYLNRAR
ncbi:helix-turn-helix domain-containing protein, partial [Kribbella jejuensis]